MGRLAPLPQGKVSREFLERAVFPNLGAKSGSLLVGPGHGLDNAVISLGRKKVLLVTSDPLSVIPAIGWERSAWLSVHLVASDLSTSGVAPQFAALDLNLPPTMDLDSVATYVKAIGAECERLGVTIVGGHTGRYPGSGYTVVGGGTMFSIAPRDGYVTPSKARPGDSVLITKGAAIGATAVLAWVFPKTVEKKAGRAVSDAAKMRLRECSTVEDALSAAASGLGEEVSSMHDATEGGVLGGLSELASACRLPVIVDREKIHVSGETRAVCDAFGLDPLTTTSEGTLIITCQADATERIAARLARGKIACYRTGSIGRPSQGQGLWISTKGSKPVRHEPARDRYWEAYAHAVQRGLK